MRFYEWRKGIIACLTQPYRYENPRWNRTVFIPKGTTFRTVHTRRGPAEGFSVPVMVTDDTHIYEPNMSASQQRLYPAANFMFHHTAATPVHAELISDDDAEDEWFSVGGRGDIADSIPYLSLGKAITYLGRLAMKGHGRPVLLHRHGGSVDEVPFTDSWITNVERIEKVSGAEHAIRGMKTRIRMDLTPEHEARWFVTAQKVYEKGKGEEAIKADFAAFRQLVSPGTPCAHYLTAAGALTSPPNVDIGQFYAFLHTDQDRVLMRIQYADDMVVQDLTL